MSDEAVSESGPRNIVLIHRYFAPDTPPYASILRKIAIRLGEQGHRVTVLTCQPSYNRAVSSSAARREVLHQGVSVRRWPVIADRSSSLAKLANLLWFCARVTGHLARMRRVDVVMAATTPPVAVALVASVVARAKGASFIYHKQDIYPEVAASGPGIGKAMRRILRAADARTDRRSTAVVVLSEDMALTIEARGVSAGRIKVLNNFDPWAIPRAAGASISESAPLRVVYAGNLGRFQNFETIFQSLRRFGNDPRFRFNFVGEGPLKEPLQELVAREGLSNVAVDAFMPPELLAKRLQNEFDLGLVSLYPGVIRAAFPSKVMSYLRNGLPVLALVEGDSELSTVLQRYGAGWAADPAIGGALDQVLEQLAEMPEDVRSARGAAHRMYEAEFSMARVLQRWVDLFESV